MSEGDTSAWRAAVGGSTEHHETPEWVDSCGSYVRDMWEYLDDPDAPPLTEPQIRARLRALHSAKADLLRLVEKARADHIEGPDNRVARGNEWSFPVGERRTTQSIGELRQPRQGCDVWRLHHRAYFAAPRVWPGSLVWSFAAFKPDQSASDDWAAIQNTHIAEADRSASAYITAYDADITAIHRRMSP
ncbi:hypothetical protein L5G32_09260 [Gordonia sp. HY002]|uniref:hypothetical protein n=1 Tax=Gordonia zhenghanii TaxID=2911516 RepID=UPI001EEFEEE9|nr:hypothetical protein [Gordonia zhenghanii]MCF8570453.1 hypothetical protein [Gordonia zhenghanii]MCF8602590.1 hypothetical protein [Gordonia zhenghanii]